ncbi:hypothetical protein CU305_07680 [Prochlorococcus marinus str. MU1416]|nr:hypothetical protein [Prochlorococcus marinus CUG1416]MBW3051904.1 hypothetical protein [Prochlorococcus marinus str. MU1416]
MPWLVSRRRVLILSIVDYSIILILFLILQTTKYINTNFLSINLLALSWLVVSYILDKYSVSQDDFNIYISKRLLRVINTSILSGVLFKFIIIFSSILNWNVGDGKWIAFIICTAFFSYLYEIFHAFIIKKYLSKDIEWISIYSNIEKGSLLSEPLYVKNNSYSKSIHKSKINQLTKLSNSKFGLIIEDINSFDNKEKTILINLKNRGYKILSLINWYERYLHRYPKEITNSNDIAGEVLINKEINSSQRIKRFSEFFLSLLLLLILSPLIFLIAVLIKIEDNGPIFYSQIRNGFAGKSFRIYKLRSMKVNAEKNGIKWSSLNDERITKVGKLIRRTRLDEVPQLLSVLNGDMSLIGPRPERPEIDEMLSKEIPNYQLRYLVRPGLSGWAQVSYPYGASVEDTKMKFSYDLYYIKNFSTLFDLLILLETIRLVFNLRGSLPK